MGWVAGLMVTMVLQAEPHRPTTIAVPDLVALGVSAEMTQNLGAVIAAELGRYDGLRVISSREIAVLLGYERSKQLLGCQDDSCVSQIADALGADQLLTGQLGLIEQSMVFTLQRIEVKSARVLGRVVKVVPVGKDRIVDAVRSGVTELMGAGSSRNQPPRLSVGSSLRVHQTQTVSLDARCYDPDGDPLHIDWQQLEGPPALLEAGRECLATFVAVELGHYVFRLSVTDGRSAPVEQRVEVEVLANRPFAVGAGMHLFAPFNRFVETDGRGNAFRNRTPYGPLLSLGLSLSDRWQLYGQGEFSYINTFAGERAALADETFEYFAFNLSLGLRAQFRFAGFKLWAGAALGSARVFLHLVQGGVVQNPGLQAVFGEVNGGVDLPLGERVGVLLKVGLRAQVDTEQVPLSEGIHFVLARDGFFAGLESSLEVYFRL